MFTKAVARPHHPTNARKESEDRKKKERMGELKLDTERKGRREGSKRVRKDMMEMMD